MRNKEHERKEDKESDGKSDADKDWYLNDHLCFLELIVLDILINIRIISDSGETVEFDEEELVKKMKMAQYRSRIISSQCLLIE